MNRLDPKSPFFSLLLVALVMAGALSTDIYLPSMPDLARQFNSPASHVQLTLSMFFAGFAVAQLIVGPLSDRFGRRPVLLWGVTLYAAASAACLFATNIETLIAGRFFQALGACAGPVVARAIVRDVYPRDQAARIFATMASIFALAPALAPIVGGNLHAWFGWKANFIVMLLFGIGQFVAVRLFLAETNARPDRRAVKLGWMAFNYATLLRERAFLGNTVMVALLFAAMFSYVSLSPFLLIDFLGVKPEHFGYCMAGVILGFLAGSQTVARLTARFGSERLVGAGAVLGFVGASLMLALALSGIHSVFALIVPAGLVFMASAMVMPSATALAIAPYARIAGSASALLGFLQMSTAALVGWLAGLAHADSAVPLSLVLVGLTAAALVAQRLLLAGRASPPAP